MSRQAAMPTATARSMNRSYPTPPEPIHDHFGTARHLDMVQPDPVDRLEQVGPGGQAWEPRREDDHVVWAGLAHEADHPLLALPPVRKDLRRRQAHEIQNFAPRHVGDGADVVDGKPRGRWHIGVHPASDADLHRLDVLHTPRVALGGGWEG